MSNREHAVSVRVQVGTGGGCSVGTSLSRGKALETHDGGHYRQAVSRKSHLEVLYRGAIAGGSYGRYWRQYLWDCHHKGAVVRISTQGAVPGKTFLREPFREKPSARKPCRATPCGGRRRGTPTAHNPRPGRPPLCSLGPAYLTEGDPRPRPPGNRARGSPSRCGGYTSMVAGTGREPCRCKGHTGPWGGYRDTAAGRGGGEGRVGGGRGARGHVGGGGGVGRAQGARMGAS